MGVYGSINSDDKEFDYTAIEEDSSLEELGKMLSTPIGKSGVNYRMKKIIDLAKQYI